MSDRKRFIFVDPGDDIQDGAVIVSGCNFMQLRPDTPIMVDKLLIIEGGNFTNVRRDDAWVVQGGNWTQVNFCTHLHPGFIALGLDKCVDDCDHVVTVDEVTIKGETHFIYTYKDEVL